MTEHVITRAMPTHTTWDTGHEPVVRAEPGGVVELHMDDFAGGQITRDSAHADVAGLDFDRIYPLAGPVWLEGAEPGDALSVEVLELEPADWGWACIIPGAGLLPEAEFPEPYLKVFALDEGDTTQLAPGVHIPVEPFLGTMGVCPAGARAVAVPPPHAGGGTMDCRHLTAGATLLLPVLEPGARFSAGDAHAAQGDGEVAISGIECAMRCRVRLDVVKDLAITAPQLRRPAGPLCSLAGDLKITEVVDAPMWMVGCFVPDAVFEDHP